MVTAETPFLSHDHGHTVTVPLPQRLYSKRHHLASSF